MSNNFYYDCEFLEGTQDKRFLGIKYGKTPPTIDLVSIAMVDDQNNELYLVSKDFNLYEAWNRYDLDHGSGDQRNLPPRKIYWIRENVLKPIYQKLLNLYLKEGEYDLKLEVNKQDGDHFAYGDLKKLIKRYGKPNEAIAIVVEHFVRNPNLVHGKVVNNNGNTLTIAPLSKAIFYGYYPSYDHVVLCWLWGKMINLPQSFPMYTRDLQQMLAELIEEKIINNPSSIHYGSTLETMDKFLKKDGGVAMGTYPPFPKQGNHSALEDARFNKELYDYIQSFESKLHATRTPEVKIEE